MNDGTLLQHACELAAMAAVTHACASQRFHLYATHPGPLSTPVEKDAAARPQLNRVLNLVRAKGKPLPSGVRLPDNLLVDAYARVEACPTDMPNTPRLLAGEARHRGLTMTAVLIDDRHELALREAFRSFRVSSGAWDRQLAKFRSYDAPWILSFPPPKVSGKDLTRLGEHVRSSLLGSGYPGIVCVLGRNLDDAGRERFWDAMVDGFDAHEIEFVAAQAPKNRTHVMGLACADGGIVAEAALAVHDSLATVAVV